jgi:hypothetical protein
MTRRPKKTRHASRRKGMQRAGTAAIGTRNRYNFTKINRRKIHTSNTGRGKKMQRNKFINLESEF